MQRRILALSVSLAIIFLAGYMFLAGCAGAGSAGQQLASNPQPTPTPSPSPTPAPSPTPSPSPSPSPSPNLTVQAALTRNYDNMRSGANLQETQLNPSTVTAAHFGKLFSLSVNEHVYGQPLYVLGLAIPGKGTHNVIFVATENDTVYAFDADQNLGAPLWKTSLLNTGSGEAPVPCTIAGERRCLYCLCLDQRRCSLSRMGPWI